MLRVIIADAALELVPEEIAGHPQIRMVAKAQNRPPTHLLLDQNQHHQACKGLEDGSNRGRPDITHYTLLSLLESPLNKSGGLEVAVHTRDGTLIRIRPDTRLPRGEARFQGVMAKLLRDGATQDTNPLLWVEGTFTPKETLAAFGKGPVIRLDENGSSPQWPASGDATVVLGGFPHGQFSTAWLEAAPTAVSLWKEPLAAWAAGAELAAQWRLESA